MNDTLDKLISVRKLMLWLNSGCNARCSMCDIWKEKAGCMLSHEQIASWAPEWKAQGLKTVVLCGESLMHPELWPIVAVLKKCELRIELLTNGLLLRKYASQVAAHCHVVRVSLDGPPDLHNRMRGIPTAYEKLAEGIAVLRAAAPDFPASARCAINRQNFRQLAETVQTAKALGLSGISFSATDVHNEEAFRRVGQINEAYIGGLFICRSQVEEFRDALDRFLDQCRADFDSGFITDTPDFLRQQVLGFYADLNGGERRPIRCNAPWTSAVLEYDGTLRPCFPMPAYGKLGEFGGLRQAVNGVAITAFRSRLNVSDSLVCRRCVDQTFNGQDT